VSDIDTLLASYDITYAWNYGSVKAGLRDLYEKAKRDQWNGSVQLDWDHAGRSRERDHPAGVQPARGLRAVSEAERGRSRVPSRDHLAAALAVHARRAGR
jgi:hypothetical protein